MNAKTRTNKPNPQSKTGRPRQVKTAWHPKTTAVDDLKKRLIGINNDSTEGYAIKARLIRRIQK